MYNHIAVSDHHVKQKYIDENNHLESYHRS